MKIIAATILFFSFTLHAIAQEDKTMTVNILKGNTQELTKNIFQYPGFLPGKVIFKDNIETEATLNYNRLFSQIFFINSKGDTLALGRPETINKVLIATDTFYFFDNGFLQQLTHYPVSNLAIKHTIKYIGKEKKGAYGTYSAVSSATSNSSLTTDDDKITTYLMLDENALFKYNSAYFLTDKFNNFFAATKKGFYNLFSKHQKELKQFLEKDTIDFNNRNDLEKLLQYLHSL